MNIVVVYGSQFGTTRELAHTMAEALSARHTVDVVDAHQAGEMSGRGVDLVFVGAPTQL